MKRGMALVHPGLILKGLYLEAMEITITQAANKLGVARKTLSQLVNGHLGVSAEMAIRLSKALNSELFFFAGILSKFVKRNSNENISLPCRCRNR